MPCKYSFFDNLFPHMVRVFFAPDDGGGSGGSGGADDDPPNEDDEDEPKYSEKQLQERINAAVQKRLAKAARDSKVADKTSEQQQAEITRLTTEVQDLKEALQKTEGSGDKNKGQLEILQKQYDRELKQLRSELDVEKKAREQAEKARRDGERAQALDAALTTARCKDMKAGRRYFDPQIIWDEVEAKWMFQTDSNNIVDIAVGVAEEMPDYLKPPAMSGGSGSQSGSPKVQAQRKEIQRLEKELEEAQKAAHASHMDTQSVAKASMLRRKLKQLQAEVG